MPKGYKHLTYKQRCQIFVLIERGDSSPKIAVMIGVNRSTVSREIKRNRGKYGYHSEQAHEKAQNRRAHSPNKKMTSQMITNIEEKIKLDWSPVQISGRLKKQGEEHVSYETIYKHIKRDKKNGGILYTHLRHRGKKYNKRSNGFSGRGYIPDRIDIEQRPAIVEEKSRLGDWELDTIIGANHKRAIVSIVDRASKFTKLVKVSRKTSEEVSQAIISALDPVRSFVLSLTADNGKEFAGHRRVSSELQSEFYFATPYHSWERGLNEHTNGLVRQYFPKGKNFDDISKSDVEEVESFLNNRPRKILGFETPTEAFNRLASAAK